MVRAFTAVLSTAGVFISSIVLAQAPNPSPNPISNPAAGQAPMRFEWVREGPAEKCVNNCREWIVATGAIVDSSVHDFEAFARARDVRGATLVLDSPGGNVVQGLALGREFRRLELTTSVGKAIKLASNGNEQRATLTARATCNSMCVFLLLGGIQRHVPDEARILVHQIWPSNKRNDANAATYSAGNVAAIQRVNGELSRYIIDMGADIELFEIASRIPPWEEMRKLSRDELRRMKIHTVDDPFSRPPAPAVASAPVRKPEPTGATATVNTLGWTLVDRRGQRALVRQHPITIEGQEIGSFEISFTCSEKSDTYRVNYQERRLVSNSTMVATDRLEAIGISIRQENSNLRALLTLEESAPGKAPGELLSRARGTVAAALLQTAVAAFSSETFAASNQQGIVVATTTAEKVRTVIRLGHTGFPEGLRQLASTCEDLFPR